ncbi:MAG: hypothetical protein CMO80_19790 [Verrucomicrobiales bacterium]|nr:hypothetical protein [Verrucomicrobiales bacterium]
MLVPVNVNHRIYIVLILFILAPLAKGEISTEQRKFFETKIRPVLVEHCYDCHSTKAKRLKADLYLDNRSAALKGSESGVVIVPGEPDKSIFIRAVRYQEESLEMPPEGKLPANVIADFVKWVEMGAPWPEDRSAEIAATAAGGFDFEKFRREHWSFKPIEKPDLPVISNSKWPIQPLDYFVHAKLDSTGMQPAEQADKRSLIRRAYFDMIGLPPSMEQVEEFVSGRKSWSAVVEALLRSEHYGERWARHWMDVARYSDGLGGFLDNGDLPEAWRYRDWLVAAFNHDVPYNEFVRRQIAGDIGAEGRSHGPGTGFFAVGPTYRSDGGDSEAKAQALAETLSDRVDTFSRAFLGLTVACARCHDHKFDPITIKDYYALAAVFKNSNVREFPLAEADVVKAYHDRQKEIAALDKRIKAAKRKPKPGVDKPEVDVDKLNEELKELKKTAPAKFEFFHALGDSGSANMHVAIRGDLRKQGELVPRRFPELFKGSLEEPYKSGSGRKELAASVVHPENPLTARVFVNRVWQWHFGKALVRSPSNFGILGSKPTHPKLLDWLAAQFMHDGWSIKNLHRLILNSATYQMSSRYDRGNFERDGDNENLWRMNPRRLEVEVWRDALLFSVGKLDRSIGGRPINEILTSNRRTLYARISRNGDRFQAEEFLRTFDFPAARSSSAARSVSTVPQQYLFMMNSKFMDECAEHMAHRIKDSGPLPSRRVTFAYATLYQRKPDTFEQNAGVQYLNSGAGDEFSRLKSYARTLLSSEEFRYVE